MLIAPSPICFRIRGSIITKAWRREKLSPGALCIQSDLHLQPFEMGAAQDVRAANLLATTARIKATQVDDENVIEQIPPLCRLKWILEARYIAADQPSC